jgi:hypothetical protein
MQEGVEMHVQEGVGIREAIAWPSFDRATVLSRYVAYIVGLAVCMLVCAWVRIDARETSLDLSSSQIMLGQVELEHERLELELASLESVMSLRQRALAMGLTDAALVIEAP